MPFVCGGNLSNVINLCWRSNSLPIWSQHSAVLILAIYWKETKREAIKTPSLKFSENLVKFIRWHPQVVITSRDMFWPIARKKTFSALFHLWGKQVRPTFEIKSSGFHNKCLFIPTHWGLVFATRCLLIESTANIDVIGHFITFFVVSNNFPCTGEQSQMNNIN